MKITAISRTGAFTLVELMISMGCAIGIMGIVLTAGVALQRSFTAVEAYSMSEGDQLRVQDYIAMDCRRATTAAVDTAAGTLTFTVPAYYDGSGNPVSPTYNASGVLQYNNGTTVTIRYYTSGTSFYRSVNGTAKAIATNVDSFTVTPQNIDNSVTCTITFSPRFVNMPGPGPINGSTVYCKNFLRNASARQ